MISWHHKQVNLYVHRGELSYIGVTCKAHDGIKMPAYEHDRFLTYRACSPSASSRSSSDSLSRTSGGRSKWDKSSGMVLLISLSFKVAQQASIVAIHKNVGVHFATPVHTLRQTLCRMITVCFIYSSLKNTQISKHWAQVDGWIRYGEGTSTIYFPGSIV